MSGHKDAPCPFCHFPTSRVMECLLGEGAEAIPAAYVVCGDCGSRGPLEVAQEGKDVKRQARFAWNLGNDKQPSFVVVQRIQTDIERFGVRVIQAGSTKVEKWVPEQDTWTRFSLEDAAEMMGHFCKRGFFCSIEVCP